LKIISIKESPKDSVKEDTLLTEVGLDDASLISVLPKKQPNRCVVSVDGVDNVQTSFAQCCHPVFGDDIIGYISHYKGIIVHRRDCRNIGQLAVDKQPQLVSVKWGGTRTTYAVPIVIYAFNAKNLLTDVSQFFAKNKIRIMSAALESQPDFSAELNLTLQIENAAQLNEVLKNIKTYSQLSMHDVRCEVFCLKFAVSIISANT
jgi:GTP pyrophosphokinase